MANVGLRDGRNIGPSSKAPIGREMFHELGFARSNVERVKGRVNAARYVGYQRFEAIGNVSQAVDRRGADFEPAKGSKEPSALHPHVAGESQRVDPDFRNMCCIDVFELYGPQSVLFVAWRRGSWPWRPQREGAE